MPEDTCTKFGFAEFVTKLLSSKKINELIKKKKKTMCQYVYTLDKRQKESFFVLLFTRLLCRSRLHVHGDQM